TACPHPIYTICTIAILASTTYIGVLKSSLFHAPGNVGKAEWDSLVAGSRRLIASPETVTSLRTLAIKRFVELPMLPLPSTSNPLTAYSYDSTFAFAVPHQRAPGLVTAVQKIPYNGASGE
ncbi:uncharacterized protein N7525_001078, partial [Penicillium rubens]|uniref:uncharacterized protein n=1 Tax=Penicillium rubens TaxID=1108849 RepID=UPI002A59CFEA